MKEIGKPPWKKNLLSYPDAFFCLLNINNYAIGYVYSLHNPRDLSFFVESR